jgi:hypothetical protein
MNEAFIDHVLRRRRPLKIKEENSPLAEALD